jgi:hypothetical protein
VPGQLPLSHGDLADRRAAAAELDRNSEGQVAAAAQEVEGLGDEGAVAVVERGVLGDGGAELAVKVRTKGTSL